ncbi:hypothetical protein ABPG77_001247 [Micractinium sp. CCAP 211/92]
MAACQAAWLVWGMGGMFAARSAPTSGSNCSARLFKYDICRLTSLILCISLLPGWPIGRRAASRRRASPDERWSHQQGGQRQRAPLHGDTAARLAGSLAA